MGKSDIPHLRVPAGKGQPQGSILALCAPLYAAVLPTQDLGSEACICSPACHSPSLWLLERPLISLRL